MDVKRVVAYGISAFLFACLYSVPHFFEYEVKINEEGHESIFWTDLRKDPKYTLAYTIYVDLIVRYLIPVAALTYTNGR